MDPTQATDSRPEPWRSWRPSPSMVVALIALFISVTGVTWAAVGLPKNSIKSKQIKNGQVKSVDVADNGLTGTDIDEATLNGVPSVPSAPVGPAGGDLAGTYPNPDVAPDAIGSSEVGPNALLGADIDELTLDTAVLQARFSGECAAGSSIRSVAQNGTVTCETDDGTSGQLATSAFGNAGLTVTSATGFTLVPGLSQLVDVPANSHVYISTDGGVMTSSAAATGFSIVDVQIRVEGAELANGGYRRVLCANTTGLVNMQCAWSLSAAPSLAAGSRSIQVFVAGFGSGSDATVSGDNTSVLQGALTTVIVKH